MGPWSLVRAKPSAQTGGEEAFPTLISPEDVALELSAPPSKILIPIDLSKRSELGVEYAATLAASLGAELLVLTNVVLTERQVLKGLSESERHSLEEAASSEIHRIVGERAPDVATSMTVTFRAYPSDAILEVADAEHVDMIVIASHGRSGVKRLMLGSVAEEVARKATIPVVIVPAGAEG